MIRFSPEADADLRDIVEWITKDNGKVVALRIYDRISASVQQLERFPQIGRAGRFAGTRELIIPGLPYIAVYAAEPGGVLVFRVIHSAMQWPPADDDG